MAEKVFTEIILNTERLETRMALLRDHRLEEYQLARVEDTPQPGSIYLGRIINLEPSLQAAFVDIGAARNAFLHYHDMLECDHEIVEVTKSATPASEPEGEAKPSSRRGRGGRNRRAASSGKAFELTLQCPSGWADASTAATEAAQQLTAFGIKTVFQGIESTQPDMADIQRHCQIIFLNQVHHKVERITQRLHA